MSRGPICPNSGATTMGYSGLTCLPPIPASWRDQALYFAQEVFALRQALNRVGERYFEGNRLLFDEELQALEAQANVWRLLLEHFNEVIVVEFDRIGEHGPHVPRLELAMVEEAGLALGQEQAAYLVDVARRTRSV